MQDSVWSQSSIIGISPTRRVQMSVISPEEITSCSVVEVKDPDLTRDADGRPRDDSLYDLRMGVTNDRGGAAPSGDGARLFMGHNCGTCGEHCHADPKNPYAPPKCPGHFGHIDLSSCPVYHLGFIKRTMNILNCICPQCGELRKHKNHRDMQAAWRKKEPRARLELTMKACSGVKKCGDIKVAEVGAELADIADSQGCGCILPRFRLMTEGDFKHVSLEKIEVRDGDEEDRISQVTAEEALRGLRKIKEESYQYLGLDPRWGRPEWFIITKLPVCPPHVRPSVVSDGLSSHDDLTRMYQQILKTKITIEQKAARGESLKERSEQLDVLAHNVSCLFDNEKSRDKFASESNRRLKGIRERLKSKHGRVRGNLMGKRVDFSARSVITGDPTLQANQLGMPRTVAEKLTSLEPVTALNIEKLQRLTTSGSYPRARTIRNSNGVFTLLDKVSDLSSIMLSEGMTVERQALDEDAVIFNRQPTLHKMSMMGHRVKILPYSTFRLNLSVTTPYNADFDGDEMNCHMPQSKESQTEIRENMMVHQNIVSPQCNSNVMGIVQDTLLGCSLMTNRDVFITRDMMMQIMMYVPDWDGVMPPPCILKPKQLWSGKQLWSMALPRTLQFERESKADKAETEPIDKLPAHIRDHGRDMTPTDWYVVIRNGQLLNGAICKKSLGTKSQGSIVHIIWKDEGPEAGNLFLSNTQLIVNYWLLHNGFTIGVGDMIANANAVQLIKEKIDSAKTEVKQLLTDWQNGDLQRVPGHNMLQSFEKKVNTRLQKAQGDAMSALREKQDLTHNRFNQMARAGSKGSDANLSSVICCVGQQNVEGQRVKYGFKHRTLPHFEKHDLSPESGGFVGNSFITGLTPQEFFFHAMGGREGLIDTAVKTADTGYIQRKLIKSMEDLVVQYDSTVRSSTGSVVQFLYGEDGLDGLRLEGVKPPPFELSDGDIAKKYGMDLRDDNFGKEVDAKKNRERAFIDLDRYNSLASEEKEDLERALTQELEALQMDAKNQRDIWAETRDLLVRSKGNDVKFYIPFNFDRLFNRAKQDFGISSTSVSNMLPHEVIQKVRSTLDRLRAVRGADRLSMEAQANATMLLHSVIRAQCNAKSILQKHRLSSESLDWILSEIERSFNRALANPGEAVGVLAAQSLGEPTTQMTLNTFHLAGNSEHNVTLGLPRLKEIINVAKIPRTPMMRIFVKEKYARNQKLMQEELVRKFQHFTIADVLESAEVWYDPDLETTVMEEDREFVEDYVGFNPPSDVQKSMAFKHILRLKISEEVRSRFSIKPEWIRDTIAKTAKSRGIGVILIAKTTAPVIMRVRICLTDEEKAGDQMQDSDELSEYQSLAESLSQASVTGIPNIKRAFLPDLDNGYNHLVKGLPNSAGGTKEWYLDLEGCNMRPVLSRPEVLETVSSTNNMYDLFCYMGVEAARSALHQSILEVISVGGAYVNYRHLCMLVDVMTYKGHLLSITRHGFNRIDTGPLMRCTFEETVEILQEAAMFSQLDRVSGVSENILLGQRCPVGTGAFDVMLNVSDLKQGAPVRIAMPEEYAGETIKPFDPSGDAPENVGQIVDNPFASEELISSPGEMIATSPQGDLAGATSPNYIPTSPGYSPESPAYSPASPGYEPASPAYTPASPAYESAASPAYVPTSPNYQAASPEYSPSSPAYSPASPAYSPSSPAYSPSSPAYSPSSPAYSPSSPAYSPSSPAYSPSSPAYSPSSPAYSPSSPAYSPSSPAYSPSSPAYSPSSPAYSPSSPAYSPSSPAYSPSSPAYSPSSPAYSPSSPAYSPSSPAYSPSSPAYSPSSPAYSPSSPAYSPASPEN